MRLIRLRSLPGALVHYRNLLEAQEAAFERLNQTGEGSLILAEVEPVITLGKGDGRTALSQYRAWEGEQGIERLTVPRRGAATYHGPGNLIIFLVERVERLVGDSKAVRRLTERLLSATLRVCQEVASGEFEIREDSEVGIWRAGTREKVASLGIELRERTLLHGVAINVYREGPSFLGISPCAIDSAQPGFLFSERDPEMMNTIQTRVSSSFSAEFGFQITSE